jgi:hypothetical protein
MTKLRWTQANPFGISFDTFPFDTKTWNAGHVNDVLAIGNSILVASDTGGVWLINPIPQTDAYPASCLSDEWLDDTMSCLAFGPDGQTQVFAGCSGAPTLYALALQIKVGEVEFVQSTTIPLPWWAGGINKIVVQQNPRCVVVACSGGILWSPIPNPFDQVMGYQWSLASGLTNGGYSGLAVGPNANVLAAAWGSWSYFPSGHYGIFKGNWNRSASALTFTRANISGTDPTKMLRTSVAVCAGNRNILYAVSDGASDSIYNVLKSQDGGQNWVPASIPPNAGNQGWYNNCIDVNPANAAMVAIGWRSGPFLSIDGASSWNLIAGSGLHSDLHCVYFPALQSDPDAFFVGSDGGVALVSGSGAINSQYNMHLLNLQFYGNASTASYQFAGLCGGGTQDNGNLSCVIDPNAASINQPWRELEGGDGGVNRFLSTGQLLRYNNTLTVNNVEVGNRVRVDSWDPNAEDFPGGLGKVIPLDGTTDGLPYPVLEIVNSAQYSRNNPRMLAIGGGRDAATQTNQKVYGLFADPNGANPHWTFLADTGENITSVGSGDGNQVIIGTDKGHIISCATATGALMQMPLSQAVSNLSGPINRILVQSDTVMFALHGAGSVLRYSGSSWDILRSLVQQQYVAIETDWTTDPKVLYVANDSSVFASTTNGQSWTNESQGLPASPHCADLRFVVQPDNTKYLYLSTYGRSLWRSAIGAPGKVSVPKFIEQVVKVLFGVIADGGGSTTGGPIPPWGPEEALFVGLLAAELAQTLPGNIGAAHLAEALQFVSLASRELIDSGAGATTVRSEGSQVKRSSPVEFGRIVEMISQLQKQAHPTHELLAGILAASLARRSGAIGKASLEEALQFVSGLAQTLGRVRAADRH